MKRILASIFAVFALAIPVGMVAGVAAQPANAGVHCYFGENLWGGFWYCVSW